MTTATLREALVLLFGGDAETYLIILRTLLVSGSAVVLGSLVGIPWGYWLTRHSGVWTRLTNAMMGIPPVVVGLFVYLFLSREGPMGPLGWLFTPWAMILAQWFLVTPIVAGIARGALAETSSRLTPLLIALGADSQQARREILRESLPGLLLAVVAGLGRALAEVGAVMLVGGNIKGSTRVLTTAIVLETRQGNFARAVALGMVLLLISTVLNILLDNPYLGRRRHGAF